MPQIVSTFAVYIAIFLFGMIVIRIGLESISKEKLKSMVITLTKTPLRGLLIGVIASGLLQSSSAVLVLTVGLVASGYLTFQQSLGVVLGVNIGTNSTLELLTLDVGSYVPVLLVVGAIFMMSKNKFFFGIGGLIFGFGCIFVAMSGFENMADPLSSQAFVRHFIEQTDDNLLFGVGIGTIFTAMIQSSTATAGIVMGFLNHEAITLPAAIAVVLGANIGTCVTAMLASIGANIEAKLVAYAHVWLNIFGVVLFFPLIHKLSQFAQTLAASPDVQIAHASLIFNTIISLIALPLVGSLTRFLLKMHGPKTEV